MDGLAGRLRAPDQRDAPCPLTGVIRHDSAALAAIFDLDGALTSAPSTAVCIDDSPPVAATRRRADVFRIGVIAEPLDADEQPMSVANGSVVETLDRLKKCLPSLPGATVL